MPIDSRLKRLIKNIFGSAASRAVNLVATLLLVPLTINSLGSEDYAFLSIAISMSLLSAYADLGMGLAIVNTLAAESESKTQRRSQRAVSVVWFTLLGISILGVILTIFFYLWAAHYTHEATRSQYFAIALGIMMVLLGLPTGLTQRVLFAQHKNIEANAWNTLGRILSLISAAIMVKTEHACLLSLMFSIVGVPTIIAWISTWIVFTRKSMLHLRPKTTHFDKRLIRPYVLLGISFLVMQLVPYSEVGIDPLLAGFLVNMEIVPSLDVHLKIFTYIPALVSIAAFPLWPSITSACASRDIAWIIKVKKISYFSIITLSSTLGLVLLFFSSEIIYAWTKRQLPLPNEALIGMAVFSIMTCLGTIQSMILSGLGAIKKQALFFLAYMIILLTLKSILAINFGITGMMLALNICYAIRLIISEMALQNRLKRIQCL